MEWTDRGDVSDPDFILTDFTLDNTERTLDLSSIVGAGVKRVSIHALVVAGSEGGQIAFKTYGNTNSVNLASINVNSAELSTLKDIYVTTDADGKLTYIGDDTGLLAMFVTIRGWFA